MVRIASRLAASAGLVLGFALIALPAAAQTDAGSASSAPGNLPVIPNAERAHEGGTTPGHPSLAGINGSSPLEPYLVTWLLPASGIFAALAVLGVDRSLRTSRR